MNDASKLLLLGSIPVQLVLRLSTSIIHKLLLLTTATHLFTDPVAIWKWAVSVSDIARSSMHSQEGQNAAADLAALLRHDIA